MRQQPVVDNFYWQPFPVFILAFVELAAKKLQQQLKLRDCQTPGEKRMMMIWRRRRIEMMMKMI